MPRDAGRATEVLYDRHGGTVFRYAWHLLGRREDAEDATQATFLAAHSALAGGTAVLEPGAWVMRIARNECMGRLRRTSRAPAVGALGEDFDPVAEGGVESAAELRDEMRTARRTLNALPEGEREAFVLREWIGLESGEVAVALGVTSREVDDLAARARRSLVLAVGGLEPAIGCAETRAALETGSLDRAGKVHLLRCPVCRGVRRALRPRDAGLASLVPGAVVAERLALAIPGFGAATAVAGSGGGGTVAALTAKAATAPFLAKAAAVAAAALIAGGGVEQAVRSSEPAHHRGAGATFGRGGEAPALASFDAGGRRPALVLAVPARTRRDDSAIAHEAAPASRSQSRGGAAEPGQHPNASQVPDGETGDAADGGRTSEGRAGDGGNADHPVERGDERASHSGGVSNGDGKKEDATTGSSGERDRTSSDRAQSRSADGENAPGTPAPATSDDSPADHAGGGTGDDVTTNAGSDDFSGDDASTAPAATTATPVDNASG